MRMLAAVTCCGLLFPGFALTQQKPAIEIKVVNHDALKKAVRDQRGKVVLVDFWGEF
jgi:hypothetical protein